MKKNEKSNGSERTVESAPTALSGAPDGVSLFTANADASSGVVLIDTDEGAASGAAAVAHAAAASTPHRPMPQRRTTAAAEPEEAAYFMAANYGSDELRSLHEMVPSEPSSGKIVSAVVLAALAVTVRTESHGPAVLLRRGTSGFDLPATARLGEGREAMLKYMDGQVHGWLGTSAATFLAVEEGVDGIVHRVYACPMEEKAFAQLQLDVHLANDAADLQHHVFDKNNPARNLMLVPVSALHGLRCEHHCLAAMAAVDTMRGVDMSSFQQNNFSSTGGSSGRGSGSSSGSSSIGGSSGSSSGNSSGDEWELRKRLHMESQRLVQLELLAAAQRLRCEGWLEEAEELVANAGSVGANNVTHVEDVPFELRGRDKNVRDPAWRSAPFSPVLEPPVTDPLPTAQPQRHTDWRPTAIKDLLTADAWTRVEAWFEGNAKDLQWMREHGSDGARPFKQEPLVLAQSDMVIEARGIVWDLRRVSKGIIVPWDFTAPIKSDLNLGFLEVLLSGCPDRELVGHLTGGVNFKADLPLQTVLLPHMNSLAGSVSLCQREIERLRGKGWSTAFDCLPALPCRLLPCGSVSRKHEPGRPRRTVNASAPHTALVDSDGVPVLSLNTAAKFDARAAADGNDDDMGDDATAGATGPRRGVDVPRRGAAARARLLTWDEWRAACRQRGLNPFSAPDRPPHLLPSGDKWPKELKPTVEAKLHDISVLRHAGIVFDEEVVGMSTDFADYFSQLNLAPSVLWTHVVHWAGLEGVDESKLGAFVLDERLGFGASPSSNIGQRLSHALNGVFRTVFDAQEEVVFAAETDPERLAYLMDRRKLGPGQCRLYEICTYTDDPFLVCVGAKRLARAVALFNRLLKAVGIAVAIPVKRQFGSSVRWLGLDFFLSLGVVVVPENKRLRALTTVIDMSAGVAMSFADYRSATSFLQYLKPFVAGADGSYFYGLYVPYERGHNGSMPDPADTVTMTPLIREQAGRWARLLRSTAGMFASAVLHSKQPAAATPFAYLYSDAALEGAAVPGLGGYMHGFYWVVELSGDALRLPISVLELIAIGINLIVFVALVQGAHSVLCSDSLNSVQVLTNLRAKSALMAHVHLKILELPEAKALGGASSAVHCFGSANPAADAISRGNMAYFHALCAQLGVAPVQLDVPAAAVALLDDAIAYAHAHGLLVPLPTQRAAKRSAAQMAHERRSGNEYSSDSEGDGPSRFDLWQQTQRGHAPELSGVPPARLGSASRSNALVSLLLPQREEPPEGPARNDRSDALASLLALAPAAGSTVRPSAKRPRDLGAAASYEPAAVRIRPVPVGARPEQPSQDRPPRRQVALRRERRFGAIHERANNLAQVLGSDPSILALRPSDPSALHTLCLATLKAAESVPAAGTLKTDDLAWERWCWYCARMGTPPLRDGLLDGAAASALTQQRETVLLSGFLLLMADTMTGRGGKGSAKPTSAFQMVLAVRRIHDRMGARFEVLPGVRKVFDSIVKTYVDTHGAEALMPRRKEPLDTFRLARLFGFANGVKLGTKSVDWNNTYWLAWRALMSVGFAAAFRKAELVLPAGVKLSHNDLTRASVSWIIGGVSVADPSEEQLGGLVTGDYCVVKPPTSKADPFGLHFCWKPIFLPFENTATNAAKNVAEYFVATPIELGRRASTALFCLDAAGTTFSQDEISRLLQHALKVAFPSEDSTRWSMHSLRIGAATALLKAGASMQMIQALCRWRSPKSVEIYARLGPGDYGRWLIRACQQRTDAITARNLPRVDYDGVITAVAAMNLDN